LGERRARSQIYRSGLVYGLQFTDKKYLDMILHGKDLIVSIDGNSMLASKSCTLIVSTKSIVRTSPNSGKWEEVLNGKKSWSLSTDHFMKSEEGGDEPVGNLSTSAFYFGNNITEGWKARGEYLTLNLFNRFDEYGDTPGITTIEIGESGNIVNIFNFDKNGMATIGGNQKSLYQYLNGDVSGYVIDSTAIIAILTVGEFVIGASTCNILSTTYHVALPCVEFGNSPTSGEKTYETNPIIIVGGKSITHGFTSLNSISNEVVVNLTSGQVYTPKQGIPNNINMVGRKVAIRMTDNDSNNGNVWAGEAIVTQFKVTGTKGNLMTGSFSFKGNGELQTDSRLYYTPTPPPVFVNRIILDMNERNPAQMITGDIDGTVLQEIMANSHRYLCKYIEAYSDHYEMAMCQLDDSDSNKFLDESAATLDGTQGDVYVRPGGIYNGQTGKYELYYNIKNLGNRRYELAISNKFISGYSIYYPEENLIGAFKAVGTESYNDNVAVAAGGEYYLRSIVANRAAMKDTITNINAAYNKMNNSCFGFVGPEEHALIALLFFIKRGTTKSWGVIGSGASIEAPVGITALRGMKDTLNYQGYATINLFGLENWWGGGMEVVERMLYANDKITLQTREGQQIEIPSFSGSGLTDPVIQNMIMGVEPLLMVPAPIQPPSTNYTLHFCNAVSFGNMGYVLRGKGGDGGGITWMGLGATGDVSARICYHGSTTIYDDPQEFLALTPIDPINY
jgi:hypothetical protein